MKRKNVLSLMIALSLIFSMLLVPQTAFADGTDGYAKYGKKMTVSTQTNYVEIDMGKKDNGAKKITVTSSKKSVAKAATGYIKYLKVPVVEIKKKGTTKLTIKIKKGSSTKTYKSTLKVVAYKNPIKKIKIGDSVITSKFNKATYCEYTNKETKEKVSIKAKSGWKVKKIEHGYWSGDDYKIKTVKNFSNVKWTGDDALYVTMFNKSRNQYETFMVNVMEDYDDYDDYDDEDGSDETV